MSSEATLTPGTEEEAAGIVSSAVADRTTLAIEGGGTKSDLGRPIFPESVLSSANLSGITSYNPSELVISARSGTPMSEINDALAKNRQRLAFEPMDHSPLLAANGNPTIGAIAAINNSGSRRIVAGAARDSLLGVRFINGQGEIVKNGGRVMKNVTGLDLVKLMAGSWGTLGFLTEVTFKVLPAPETEATLLLRGLDDEQATNAMAHAMAISTEVSGAAHLPDLITSRLLGGNAATALRLEGFSDSVRSRMERLKSLFSGTAELEDIDAEQSASLWKDIRDVEPFAGNKNIVWRVSMKPSEAHKFVMAIRMKAAVDAYYDWQGGLVWLSLPEDDPQDEIIRTELANHGGGHAMLIRADSEIRVLVPVFEPLAPPVEQLSRRIKAAFDPKGIFNPGIGIL